MKKFIFLMLMMLMPIVASAQRYQIYQTTQFASATVYNGTYYWGDWERSNLRIVFDLAIDVITIYSPTTQKYMIYSGGGNATTDSSGGRQVKFYVIDQDGDRGTIRLRIERNGNSQIYVDFSNIAFVYNVRRIQ